MSHKNALLASLLTTETFYKEAPVEVSDGEYELLLQVLELQPAEHAVMMEMADEVSDSVVAINDILNIVEQMEGASEEDATTLAASLGERHQFILAAAQAAGEEKVSPDQAKSVGSKMKDGLKTVLKRLGAIVAYLAGKAAAWIATTAKAILALALRLAKLSFERLAIIFSATTGVYLIMRGQDSGNVSFDGVSAFGGLLTEFVKGCAEIEGRWYKDLENYDLAGELDKATEKLLTDLAAKTGVTFKRAGSKLVAVFSKDKVEATVSSKDVAKGEGAIKTLQSAYDASVALAKKTLDEAAKYQDASTAGDAKVSKHLNAAVTHLNMVSNSIMGVMTDIGSFFKKTSAEAGKGEDKADDKAGEDKVDDKAGEDKK